MLRAASFVLSAATPVEQIFYVDVAGSLDRLDQLADGLEFMVWCHEPIGRCIFLNTAWERLKGVPRAAGYGVGWLQFIHPADQARVWNLTSFAQAHRLPLALTFRTLTARRRARWTRSYGVPVLSRDRRRLRYLGASALLGRGQPRELEAVIRRVLYPDAAQGLG